MPNRLSQFWQELKRRNVPRVVTVYAGAAFVIIELINNITGPLRLPEWTSTLVIVLLAIGFPVIIIFSWIYDVHPEGGMVKTGPAHKVKPEDIPKSSNSWKIASYISFVVIVGLIVLNIIPRSRNEAVSEILDKSIAVLPFINDSPDEEKMYFINGTMDAILDNLCKIADLRVVSRTSVEQYRNNPKPIPVVAEEMNVSYILEGSGQKIGNRVLLIVQLIDGKTDHHLWSKQYDREIGKVEDLIDIQKEIAELVAGEIEVIITPEEHELIEKIPTTNLTAYDFYQRGREEHRKYRNNNEDKDALERAEELYHRALAIDSTFARAYTGLAWVYNNKYYWQEFFSENFMDSAMLLVDKAISYDHQLPEAYLIKGNIFLTRGLTSRGIEALDQAIRYNPNYRDAYYRKGLFYLAGGEEMDKAILNLHKASELQRDQELPVLFRWIAVAYEWYGFMEQGNVYLEEALSLDGDSANYFRLRAISETYTRNYLEANEFLKKAYANDSLDQELLRQLGDSYMNIGQYEKSLEIYKKLIKRLQETGNLQVNQMHRVAYAFWVNGYEKEADEYMDLEFGYCEDMIRLNRGVQNRNVYYDLAGVYAFRNQKEQALENLRIFNEREKMPLWVVSLIKDDHLFDNIRDEPGFLQIVQDIETKYQAEHERVRKWLEENDLL